jgi:SAM-dependent methyltransferase
MTPELRVMALDQYEKVISIDINPAAIDIYKDWIPGDLQHREQVIEANWLDVLGEDLPQADVILGDGVFGNLPDIQTHHELLDSIKRNLKQGGQLITRKFTVPGSPSDWQEYPGQLRQQYSEGRIDGSEFGFAMRLLGHLACCYDQDTAILDCGQVYREADEELRSGQLTARMREEMEQFFFSGSNCLVTDKAWEEMLTWHSIPFEIMECSGKHWYSYYRVYSCRVKPLTDQGLLPPGGNPTR